jgi:hypothetical protein
MRRQREMTLEIANTLSPSEFLSTLRHPGMGEVSVFELMSGLARHEQEHAQFIRGDRPRHGPRRLTAETIPQHRV